MSSDSTIERFTRATDPAVRGFLHRPATDNGNALVLTHGAGSNAQAPLLLAVAEAFCAAGFTVLRCDLPYRQSRSFGPPGPADAARDRAGLKNAVIALQKELGQDHGEPGAPLLAPVARSGSSRKDDSEATPPLSRSVRQGGDFVPVAPGIVLAGHSYGGRQASILCTEQQELVAGLLLLSYPLHPPRKPEQQRTQHLPDLRTPTLFIHGTRDPFGSIAELENALKMIPAKTKLLTIEDAGHDLGFKGRAKNPSLMATVLAAWEEFFRGAFT